MLNLHFGRARREAVSKCRNERGVFTARRNAFDDPASIRSQHAPLIAHADTGNTLANRVHEGRCAAPEPGVLTRAPVASDDVMSCLDSGEQLRNFLRGI